MKKEHPDFYFKVGFKTIFTMIVLSLVVALVVMLLIRLFVPPKVEAGGGEPYFGKGTIEPVPVSFTATETTLKDRIVNRSKVAFIDAEGKSRTIDYSDTININDFKVLSSLINKMLAQHGGAVSGEAPHIPNIRNNKRCTCSNQVGGC